MNKAYVATPLLRYGLVFVHISQDDRRLSDPQHSAAGRAKRGALCAHQDMRGSSQCESLQKAFYTSSSAMVMELGEQQHTCATFVAEQDTRRYTQYSSVTLANDVYAANEACTVGHGDAWVRHSWMAGFGQTSHTKGWTSWGARVSPRWCTTDGSRLHSSWKPQARRVDVASSNRITSRRRFVVVWYSFASPIDSNAHA